MLWVLLAVLLHPNTTPKAGELGAFYFDTPDETQVWVNMEPQLVEHGPNPVQLTVTVAFKGRVLKTPPDHVSMRAAASGTAFPTKVRQAILRFELLGGRVIDLTAPDGKFLFSASCDKCAADVINADISFDDLQALARSSGTSVEALGFSLVLSPQDIAGLQRLVKAVNEGITLAPR